MLKREISHLGLNEFKQNRRETYPMTSLGEGLLEANVICFSGGSLKDKSETLILGMHYDISMRSSYSL